MIGQSAARTPSSRATLGFLGVGWIGRNRMEAILDSGMAEAVAISEPAPDMLAAARELAPRAEAVDTLKALIHQRPDGIVIATPSALHAQQCIQALEAGIAVFCQKPLGRNAAEVAAVIDAARRNDALIGVDLSYRHTQAMRTIRQRLRDNAIGSVFAADLTFHNAYGPDKAWFYDRELSGGGCVIDLGVHLVDLLLGTLDFPSVEDVSADLYADGRKLRRRDGPVEDYAAATLELGSGAVARLACSWRLHAGCDAVISAVFHGTEGSLAFSNLRGSFYDFKAELWRGTQCELLVAPPDAWGGRAAVDWAERLASGNRFDPDAERLLDVAKVLDRIYGVLELEAG